MDSKRTEIPGICQDSKCGGAIEIRTLCCVRCGVSHSEACPACGRFGFHREDCAELLQESDTVITEVCGYCDLVLGHKPGGGESGKSWSICRTCWEKHIPYMPYPENES